MVKRVFFMLFVGVSFLVIGCQQSAQYGSKTRANDKSPVLARVDGQTITEADLKIRQEAMHFGEKERQKVIEDMIRNKLIYLAAVADKVDQEPDVQARVQDQIEKIVGQIYLNDKVTSLDLSESELRKYYDAHKDDYKVPRKATIAHILVSTKDAADKIKSELTAGTITFDQAVAKYSQDKLSARNQGRLGVIMEKNFIPMLGPYPEISEQIFQAKPEDVIGPFETNKGFHLIRIEAMVPEEYEGFEQAKRRIIDRLAVSDQEIEDYYNKVKDERFKKRAYVKARHIQTDSQVAAEKVIARLKKGEKFADLVREVSLDKESVNNEGDLGMIYQDGFVARIGKDPNFIKAVFQLEKGEISPVIKSAKGYHVVEVYEKEPDSYHPLADVRPSIINILAGQKRVELRTKLMSDLEQKYKVERLYKK